MGVTGFYLALTKMFPSAAKKIAIRSGRATLISDNRRIPFSPDFMHLLFDCNSELYSAAGRVSPRCHSKSLGDCSLAIFVISQLGEDELDHMSAKLWESLDSLINAVSSPSPSSIFLALDGPGNTFEIQHHNEIKFCSSRCSTACEALLATIKTNEGNFQPFRFHRPLNSKYI